MSVTGAGGLEGGLAVAIQALRDSAAADRTALKLVESAGKAQGGNAAPQVNAGLSGEPGDPNAPKGTYLDIRA